MMVYMAMPMDVMLSLGEFQQKAAQGRVILITFTYGYDGWLDLLGQLIKPIILFVPVGILFQLRRERRGRLGSVRGRGTISWTCALATVMDLVPLCLYPGKSDITDMITACIGSWLGAMIASRCMVDDG